MKIRRNNVGGNQGRSSSCPGCGNSPKGIPIITIIILLVLFGLMLPSTFHVFMIHPDTNSDHVLRSSINNESNLDANHEVKGGPKAIDWSNPFEPGEEERFSCDWTTFESISSHRREPMCVHSFPDIVSQFVKDDKRWRDCNNLPTIWNATLNVNSNGASTNQNEKRVYVDIGANIGSCVMEMLLGTDADIIAFEPHPMNLFNIKKTISKLDPSYQKRLRLYPIGLGKEKGSSTIYSAHNNMGNSMIGKIIPDSNLQGQKFLESLQFTVNVDRLDSVVKNNNKEVIHLMKMDAQGFECNVMDGIDSAAESIDIITFEMAGHHLTAMGCSRDGLLSRMRNHGFELYTKVGESGFSGLLEKTPLNNVGVDLFAVKKGINVP